MQLNKVHHVAVICSDYERSKLFYTDVLGMKIKSEHYREQRHSWKADCYLGDTYVVELFSFPNPPARPSYPEAAGLRHLASRWTTSRQLSANSTTRASRTNLSARTNTPANSLCSSATPTECR